MRFRYGLHDQVLEISATHAIPACKLLNQNLQYLYVYLLMKGITYLVIFTLKMCCVRRISFNGDAFWSEVFTYAEKEQYFSLNWAEFFLWSENAFVLFCLISNERLFFARIQEFDSKIGDDSMRYWVLNNKKKFRS